MCSHLQLRIVTHMIHALVVLPPPLTTLVLFVPLGTASSVFIVPHVGGTVPVNLLPKVYHHVLQLVLALLIEDPADHQLGDGMGASVY